MFTAFEAGVPTSIFPHGLWSVSSACSSPPNCSSRQHTFLLLLLLHHLHLRSQTPPAPWRSAMSALLFSHMPWDERSEHTDWLPRLSRLICSYRPKTKCFSSFHPYLTHPPALDCSGAPYTFSFGLIHPLCLTDSFCCYDFYIYNYFYRSCCTKRENDRVVTHEAAKRNGPVWFWVPARTQTEIAFVLGEP